MENFLKISKLKKIEGRLDDWKVFGEECSWNAWRFEDLGDPTSRRAWSLGILEFWKEFKALDLVQFSIWRNYCTPSGPIYKKNLTFKIHWVIDVSCIKYRPTLYIHIIFGRFIHLVWMCYITRMIGKSL